MILLSLVESVTEFLPISSTAHLLFFNNFLKISENEQFIKIFDVVVQSGSILAVIYYFRGTLFKFSNLPYLMAVYGRILVGFLPVAVIGFFGHDIIKEVLFDIKIVPYSLIIGGVVILLVDKKYRQKDFKIRITDLSLLNCFIIGIFQSIAIIPGVSRSGASMVGCLLFGCSRVLATELTFMLSIPTIFGAAAFDIYKNYDFLANHTADNVWLLLGIGMCSAFIFSLLVIKNFLAFVRRFNLSFFGYYRILAGFAVLAYLLL